MARLPRLNVPDIPQHVIQRGNNRQVCFFEERDYQVYLEKLEEYAYQFDVKVHAYVLMTNHVHLLMTPTTEKGVSKLMQSLGRYYVQYINKSYRRTGTLWEGRYKSTLVDSTHYFLMVSRYIELNPVRAYMVALPSEYPWSSFLVNGKNESSTLINFHESYLRLGKSKVERCLQYLNLFKQTLPDKSMDEIRHCTNKHWVLGSDKFKNQIATQVHRPVRESARGGDRKSQAYVQKNQTL